MKQNNTNHHKDTKHPTGYVKEEWKTLIYLRNGSFSLKFMPESIKKLKCGLVIKQAKRKLWT